MSKYYIAYGSNMNIVDMKKRCPTARMIGTLIFTGYKLMFNRYATIVKNETSRIPTVIWEITEKDEERLDEYEGFPKLYHKEYIPSSINNKKVEGLVYVMNDFVPMPPTRQYFNTILSSYKKHTILISLR